MLDINIAADVSRVATEARRKADYMRYLPEPNCRNSEQAQTISDALEEIAVSLEKVVAKYFIFYQLMNDERMKSVISRQCRTAIKREIQREHATLGG